MKFSEKKKIEKEVDDLIIFIGNYIDSIDKSEQKLKDFAELCGFGQENLTRYRKYAESIQEGERHPDPHLRTFYTILRTILGRPPIIVEDYLDLKLHKFKSAQERDKLGILYKIIALILSDIDLEPLAASIDVLFKRINISPKEANENS